MATPDDKLQITDDKYEAFLARSRLFGICYLSFAICHLSFLD